MNDRNQRMALNEALFRSANERILDHAEAHDAGDGMISFYCECADRDCVERVLISGPQYEAVRADPALFLVLPRHVQAEIEVVVRTEPEFLVVRKLGEADLVAAETDPRR